MFCYYSSHAREEPASSEPYVNGPWNVDHMNGFLMLMSDGLYDVYGKVIDTNVPQVCGGACMGECSVQTF